MQMYYKAINGLSFRREVQGVVPHPFNRTELVSLANQRKSQSEISAGGICVRIMIGKPFIPIISQKLCRKNQIEWRLPKGHLEKNETLEQAALREIYEETGIAAKLVCYVDKLNYTYCCRGTKVNKVVHHYLMEYVSGEITEHRDPDGEIGEAKWVELGDAIRELAFDQEKEIVRMVLNLLYPNRTKI